MKTPLLLRLPAEIRSLIFEFAVIADKPLVTFRVDEYQGESYAQAVQPPLTQTSRQIRRESLPIYYESNNFILHTESPKVVDAQNWLRCNSPYLADLRRLSFWLRYVSLANDRPSCSGAISISISRPRKCDGWHVSSEWSWITVVRRPPEVKGDAKYILGKLREMTPAITPDTAGPEDYAAVLAELRLFYIQEKMS